MKKYLYSALALPLLFACSSENFDEKVISNDQFAGIEKVDATFSMEGFTRFDGGVWTTEEDDVWGFAWLGGGDSPLAIDGNAWQNHNLIQTSGIFTPQTSIYVGNYFLYRPYDKTTVTIGKINFKSLEEQPLAEGYESAKQPWKDLAKTAINIGDKWTNVTAGGTYDAVAKKTWDKAGIKEHYNIYAALFSNQTGLDLTYTKNDPTFAADKNITGATDINLTLKKGEKVGAAVIYSGTIQLEGAAKSFTYAPGAAGKEPVVAAGVTGAKHNGSFWADKSGASVAFPVNATNGFDFTPGAITLNAGEGGVKTEDQTKGWFWFNSLPNTAGTATEDTKVLPVFETSYGTVTVKKEYPATDYTVKDCAYALNVEGGTAVFHPLANVKDDTKTPKVWAINEHNTFINQYGNQKGKYSVTVDFSKGVMNNMHIQSDAHLQQALKYYIASGKTEAPVVLNLDENSSGTFAISKISIALIQTINAGGVKVLVQPCGTHGTPRIVITQAGQTAENGQAEKHDVPELKNVFASPVSVDLSAAYAWTWNKDTELEMDDKVTGITLLGNTLTVYSTNVAMSNDVPLAIGKGAKMKITKVTTVKNALTNRGTINVGDADNTAAELRAYGVAITNDATSLDDYGVINNWGVVGVTYNTGVGAQVNNYGTIDMKQPGAITLLTSNEVGGAFQSAFNAGTNKLGTVKLPGGAPNALVSVSNGAETGFIEYVWDGGTTYATPNNGTVKYNTIIVSTDIKFTEGEDEIQYIKFNGVRTQVINPTDPADDTDQGYLGKLKGIIVEKNSSIIIEKNNGIVTTNSAHLKSGAAIYQGGIFNPQNANIVGKTVTDYLGTWSTDQVVVY